MRLRTSLAAVSIASAAFLLSACGETATTPEASPTAESETPGVPGEYTSALTKAEIYADSMNMSKAGIYDQLTAAAGEGFSPEAAQYAVDNLDADYNANALAAAQLYQSEMAMSPADIQTQLSSEYGDKFTAEEAAYAVENLDAAPAGSVQDPSMEDLSGDVADMEADMEEMFG